MENKNIIVDNMKKDTKYIECIICHEIKEAPKFRSPKNFVCDDCKANEIDRIKENRLKERNYEPYICLTCSNPFIEDYRIDVRRVKKEEPRFCCQPCAAKYSSNQIKNRETNLTKLIECTICHKLEEVNIHTSSKNFICKECKEKEKRRTENNVLHIPYKYPKDCILGRFERSQAYKQKSINLQKLGFNFDILNWEEEFFRIRNILYKMYYEEEQSILMIQKYFGFCFTRTVTDMLKLFGFFKIRNLTEGGRLAFRLGRNNPAERKSPKIYNHGWIDTPYGKFYYRSNYELSLIKFLVEHNLLFTCNKEYLSYISSKDQGEHTAYPDFYIPEYNILIEVKNDHAYVEQEQNLIDRYETGIKPKGIDFIVISCKGKYAYKTKEFIFKGFKVLKSFIEDKEKEKQILDLLDIKE